MTVNKERVAELVARLRTEDQATQGTMALKQSVVDPETGHPRIKRCCLGVAEELKGTPSRMSPGGIFRFEDDLDDGQSDVAYWQTSTLTKATQEWYGFASRNPHIKGPNGEICTAARANDSLGWTFAEIADGFERMYLT